MSKMTAEGANGEVIFLLSGKIAPERAAVGNTTATLAASGSLRLRSSGNYWTVMVTVAVSVPNGPVTRYTSVTVLAVAGAL